MKDSPIKTHRIDVLFPITLFFVLTVFALMVVMLAANIYGSTTTRSHQNHQSRIALSYINEKIHQNKDCTVSIGVLEDSDALILSKAYNDSNYYTYLYYYDGALRELFVKENVSVSLTDGKEILKLSDFSMKEADNGLLYFSCTDARNQFSDSYVSVSDLSKE